MGRKPLVIALVLIGVIVAAAILFTSRPTRRMRHPPNDDPWVLVSYDPDNKFGTYLGNGFISTRIMGDGVGSQNGKPLPCFMAGFYCNEKLVAIPTWSDLRFYFGRDEFRIDKKADYRQTLNMRTGIFTTEAIWHAGDKTLKGRITVVLSRDEPGVGLVSADLTPDFNGGVRFESVLSGGYEELAYDFKTGGEAGHSEYRGTGVGLLDKAVQKVLKKNVNVVVADCQWTSRGYRLAPGGKTGLGISKLFVASPGLSSCLEKPGVDAVGGVIKAREGQSFTVDSWSAIATGHPKGAANRTQALLWHVSASKDAFVSSHKRAWAKLWQRDIIIDGPKKDQQVVHSCMFYLLESVREGSQWSIPPMGLSKNAFSGHVFWDADTWMFPALILQHPELARSIVDYRYNTLPGAMANAKASGYKGAEYAWESGYTGIEDTPTGLPYRHERHIDGDIALAQWQYYLFTGDLGWLKTRGYPVLKATADYWASRAVYVPEKRRYEIHQVVPPDENAELVNNSAYTNAIAQLNLRIASRAAKLIGAVPDPMWEQVAGAMYIPYDPKNERFIAFDGYRGVQAKQADTELLVYPLQVELPGARTLAAYQNTFGYYAPKVMPNGPAMSSSAHAVIAARLGERDRAYEYWKQSWNLYLRGPFNYFNEKRSKTWEQMCFLTGAAGPIQSTIYGFAGLRLDYLADDPKGVGFAQYFCLPKQWKSLKITGCRWRGHTYDIQVKGDRVTHEPVGEKG